MSSEEGDQRRQVSRTHGKRLPPGSSVARARWHMPIVPAPGRPRRIAVSLASLCCRVSSVSNQTLSGRSSGGLCLLSQVLRRHRRKDHEISASLNIVTRFGSKINEQ